MPAAPILGLGRAFAPSRGCWLQPFLDEVLYLARPHPELAALRLPRA